MENAGDGSALVVRFAGCRETEQNQEPEFQHIQTLNFGGSPRVALARGTSNLRIVVRLERRGAYSERLRALSERERLDMEDELLFPLADKYLSATDWARIEREFRRGGDSELRRFEQRRLAIAQQIGCGCEALAA